MDPDEPTLLGDADPGVKTCLVQLQGMHGKVPCVDIRLRGN